MPVLVCAYCRVSTNKDDQLNSLEYQTSYFEEHVRRNDKLSLFRVYADEGLTGTSWDKRTDFKAMLYDAGLDIIEFRGELTLRDSDRAPKFNRILVKDVSRWARDVGALDVLKRLKQRGVFVDFITANLSTESLSDDILVGLMMLLAESDSKDKSTKVIFGHAEGARKGRIVTADKFYGYRYIKETNDLEIVPEEADVIRRIYDLYIAGEGFRNIVKIIKAEGIRTRDGKPFVQTSVRRMLSNLAYTGVLVRNKYDTPRVFSGKKTSTLKDPSEWITHEGRIPAIISEETFAQAQEIRESKVDSFHRRGVKVAKNPFAGVIICGKCGKSYIRNQEAISRGGRKYYVCSTKKHEGVKVCGSENIDEKTVLDAIEWLSSMEASGWLSKHVEEVCGIITIGNIEQSRSKLDRQSEANINSRQVQLTELNERKERLAELYILGSFSQEKLTALSADLEVNIKRLTLEIAELSRTNSEILEDIHEYENLIDKLKRETVRGNAAEYIASIKIMSKNKVHIGLGFSDTIKKHINPNRHKDLEWLDRYTVELVYETD